ncbi:MAG: DNA translocase FtsK, partial [Oscillibacter sp.]
MASTAQKKPAAPAKKSPSRAPKKAQKRPVRREVGGICLLVLALCVFVSYAQIQAVVLDWFAMFLKGMLGYGYWLTGPALAMAGLVLLFHHGKPVALRTTCTLLLPLLLGTLLHMLLVTVEYRFGFAFLKDLWLSGVALTSGGVLSGTLAEAAVAAVSKLVSAVIFTALFVIFLMIAIWPTVNALLAKHRARPRYEEKPAAPEKKEPAIRLTPLEPVARPVDTDAEKKVIDIPLDDGPLLAAKKQPSGLFTGFFRHKSEQQKTPDQVLDGKTDRPAAASPPPAPIVPAIPEMAPPPDPIPAPPVAEVGGKKAAARAVAAAAAAVSAEIAEKPVLSEDSYQYPPVTLLRENKTDNYSETGAELRNNSRRLAETLASFGVDAKPGDVVHGPSVTRYEFVLDQGVKLSKITNLSDDIALALGASGVRIAPILDKISVVGIEVPNKQVTPVLIREVLESRDFADHKSAVAFALGKDIGGRNIIGDISRLPHVLVAGTTGSGKSVCTNSLIVSL